MMISFKRRFLFVACPKTGSSSIEAALLKCTDIAVRMTAMGKHLKLSQIKRRFSWVFDHCPLESFFVFCVMRDPLDVIISLYNAHGEPRKGGTKPTHGNMPFDDFARQWINGKWMTEPQHSMFTINGEIAVNALIDFSDLQNQFKSVCNHLGFTTTLRVTNASPQLITRDMVAPETRNYIETLYSKDYEIYQKLAGKMLVDGVWVPIPPVVGRLVEIRKNNVLKRIRSFFRRRILKRPQSTATRPG